MSITDKQSAIGTAVAEMALMKFFPGDEFTRASLMTMLDRMCESAESVQWLGRHMCSRYAEWPGGAVVRGVYCSRYKPMDGIDGNLPAGDVTFREAEQRAIDKCNEYKALPPAGMALVLELMAPAGVVVDELRRKQDARWSWLCGKYPVPRVFRTLSNEFGTATTERRTAILEHIEEKLAPVFEKQLEAQYEPQL